MSNTKQPVQSQNESSSAYKDASAWKPIAPIAIAIGAAVVLLAVVAFIVLPRPSRFATKTDAQEGSAATQGTTASEESEEEGEETEPAESSEPEEEYVEPREVMHEVLGSSAETVGATNAYGILTQAVGSLEDKGYDVSFVVHDMQTDATLAYQSDMERYPASSIKGPYVTSLYQQLVETGNTSLAYMGGLAEATIVLSDNESFRTLHQTYGESVFANWLEGLGVGPGSYGSLYTMTAWYYPHVSADQLALMWSGIYHYLTGETEAAQQLASFFASREVAPIREAVGADVVSWGKAGWYEAYAEYGAEPATVDAGVVFSQKGPYVVVVMTDIPADVEQIVPLLSALDRAHQDMV